MNEYYIRVNSPQESTVYYMERLAKEFNLTTNNKGDFIDLYGDDVNVMKFAKWLLLQYIEGINKVSKNAGLKVVKCEVTD